MQDLISLIYAEGFTPRDLWSLLSHPDGSVRCYASWARIYAGIRPEQGVKPSAESLLRSLESLKSALDPAPAIGGAN